MGAIGKSQKYLIALVNIATKQVMLYGLVVCMAIVIQA
jgi:hypothetical protein